MSAQEETGFPTEVIDRVVEILGIKQSDQFIKKDGSAIATNEEIRQRLDSIRDLFGKPASFDRWVPPSKMRKLFKVQHKKISDALDILRSFSGPVIRSTELSKKSNLARMWLYEASEVNPDLSPGLVGYDVATFDESFSTAIKSLEKVEKYFLSVLNRAESSVKGRGETKPENDYANHLLGMLCSLYRDVTGEIPNVSLHKDTGTARGKLIEFLGYILLELSYPYERTHYALEKKVRGLKMHELYGQLWLDEKR